jgi:pimeloyl-ACP methyl ester carboxylesterase
LEGLNALDLSSLQSRKEADDQLAAFIPELGIRQFLLKSLGRDANGFAWKINLSVIAEQIEEVGKALEVGTVFDGPTLFLGGANSSYIQQQDLPDINTHFPNAEWISIPNAGHWLHAEQPQAVVSEMRKFLG